MTKGTLPLVLGASLLASANWGQISIFAATGPVFAERGQISIFAQEGPVFAERGQILIFAKGGQASQHEGHQTAAQPAQPNPGCAQGGQQTLATIDVAARRLEDARQTNSAADMRAVLYDLQAALGAMRSQLAPCRADAAATPSSHEHHSGAAPGTPVTQPGATAPARGAVQPVSSEAIDPVCAMKVDPKTAPKADYQGKTYYFCSESDRQVFLKDPAKYVKKE